METRESELAKTEELKETIKKIEQEEPSNSSDNREFSSEIYKLEIKNLPKQFGFGQFRKFLSSLNLKYVKVKSPANATHAFVTFINEVAREEALKVLNNSKFKGKQLEAIVFF
jgi:tRNA (uracil-5-)-methyltransferase